MDEQQKSGREQQASSFNFDSIEHAQKPAELGDDRKRSPSPSTVSTASSGSPLIRSNSSTSSLASNATRQAGATRSQDKHLVAAAAAAAATKRPAPTSIAAAQLQQQLQQHRPELGSPRAKTKHSSGNKLAHMALVKGQLGGGVGGAGGQGPNGKKPTASGDQQAVKCVQDKPKRKLEEAEQGGGANKSFGYKLGKMLAYRAYR